MLFSVENTKLWKRMSSKIMIPILIALTFGVSAIYKAEQPTIQKEGSSTTESQSIAGDWKQQLITKNAILQNQITIAEKSKAQNQKTQIDSMKMQVAENKYRVANNIESDGTSDFWSYADTSGLGKLVALFAIIACSALVAGEFSENTMKMMIPRPYKRWQLLTAKLISILSYAVVLTAVLFISSIVATAIFFGTKGIGAYVLLWMGGKVIYLPGLVSTLITTGFDLLEVIVYIILAFTLATIFRSTALATGASIFLMFAGSFTIYIAYNFSWGKFILFCDTGFSSFIISGAPFYGITLSLELIKSAVYCVVLLAAGYITFQKRDIC
jgi:ABC-2 type transport system permease protein